MGDASRNLIQEYRSWILAQDVPGYRICQQDGGGIALLGDAARGSGATLWARTC